MLVYSVSTTVESKRKGQGMFRREPGQWFNLGNRGHVKNFDANFEKLMSGTFGMAYFKYGCVWKCWVPLNPMVNDHYPY